MDHKTIFPKELTKAVGESVGSVYAYPEPANDDRSLYGLEGIVSTIYIKGDIVGKISMFIRTVSGAKIVAKMLGVEELPEDSPDILDGVGEIVNIMTGCLEMNLEQYKIHVEISVPSTRVTSIMPIGRWENNIEQIYKTEDIFFKVCLSYRFALKEEKVAEALAPQAKLKLSAADLLKQVLAKGK